jgi:hypothetical protein
MMNHVYLGAEKILAWLGPDKEKNAVEAVRSINVMYEECRRITNDFQNLIALSMTKDPNNIPEDPSSCIQYVYAFEILWCEVVHSNLAHSRSGSR